MPFFVIARSYGPQRRKGLPLPGLPDLPATGLPLPLRVPRLFGWRRNSSTQAAAFSQPEPEQRPARKHIPDNEAPFQVTDTLIFDCHGFICFVKDDVRPLMRALIHTDAFKVRFRTVELAILSEPYTFLCRLL